MITGLTFIALYVALPIFALGFLIRASAYFKSERKQKEEIIQVLQEIRDALKK